MGRFFFLPPPKRGWTRRDGGALPLLLAVLFFGVLGGAAAVMLFCWSAAGEPDASTIAALLPATLLRSLWRALRFFLLLFL